MTRSEAVQIQSRTKFEQFKVGSGVAEFGCFVWPGIQQKGNAPKGYIQNASEQGTKYFFKSTQCPVDRKASKVWKALKGWYASM